MTGVRGRDHPGRVDLDAFVRDGYVAIRGAVDADTVAASRELIWAALERRGVRRDDPGSWPPFAGNMDGLAGEPFVAAYLAPALTAAYDALIGPGRWKRPVRPADLGKSVMVRFPAEERANAGYHIEGSYAAPDGSSANWVNIRSRARGLLALMLFTDVGRRDAPTRLLCGSHLTVPRFLAPCGEAGTDSDTELWFPSTLCLNTAHATGRAGDVFLCHPFMVHTATWPHRGTGPRMIAQPAVSAPDGFALDGSDPSPVAQAIVKGLAMA
jgi:Phytanoyl-CoA dioxygenase (PhyH)